MSKVTKKELRALKREKKLENERKSAQTAINKRLCAIERARAHTLTPSQLGATVAATCVFNPFTARDKNIRAGICDGGISDSTLLWVTHKTSGAATKDAAAAYQSRWLIRPTLYQHILEMSTQSADSSVAAWAQQDNSHLASIQAAGFTHFRCVAMGVRFRCTSREDSLSGDWSVTQIPTGSTLETGTIAVSRDVESSYQGTNNKPGVIYQAFWMPPDDRDAVSSVTAGAVSGEDSDLMFIHQGTASDAMQFDVETCMLVELVSINDTLIPSAPFLGSPDYFSECVMSHLSDAPQFCLKRNAISDDVLDWLSGVAKKAIKAVKGANSLVGNVKGLLSAGKSLGAAVGLLLDRTSSLEIQVAAKILAGGIAQAPFFREIVAQSTSDENLLVIAKSICQPTSFSRAHLGRSVTAIRRRLEKRRREARSQSFAISDCKSRDDP